MLIKYTLKNIFSKPGRLLILVLCTAFACFAAFLALDIGNSIKDIIHQYLSGFMGSTDFVATYDEGLKKEYFEGCPEANIILIQSAGKREVKRDEKLYTYALAEDVLVYGFEDVKAAYEAGIVHDDIELSGNEIAIGKKYSKNYGYKTGDSITFYDIEKNPVEGEVKYIFEEKGFFSQGELSVIASTDFTEKINGSSKKSAAFIDVLDDDYEGFRETVKENNRYIDLQSTYLDEEMDQLFNNIKAILYLVFILAFVLVIFVTVSFSQKIINERMSVIGTFRSLGISRAKTSGILLFENVLYGLIGSISAAVIYSGIRTPVLNSVLIFDGDESSMTTSIKPVSALVYTGVIIGAVLIELAVPFIELRKVSKTSIRDIIFANKDTEFTVSGRKTIAGTVFIIASVILGFAVKNIFCKVFAVLLLVLGTSMTVQFVVRLVSSLLAKLFARLKMPVAELAAIEAGSKKSNMGNSVLAVTAITAACAIFIVGMSMLEWSGREIFEADVIVSDIEDMKTEDLEFAAEADGVKEAEIIHYAYDAVVQGKKDSTSAVVNDSDYTEIYALPETDMLTGIRDCPEKLEINEFAADKKVAERLGIKVGETKLITFRYDGIFPVEKNMKLVGITDTMGLTDSGGMVISRDLFRQLYSDRPNMMLIRTDNPEKVKKKLSDGFTGNEKIQLFSEYMEEVNSSNRSLRAALYAVIAAAVGLSLIGISGNQVIGFESRRKEFALLNSVAMPVKKLKRLIYTENTITFGISVILAGLCSAAVTRIMAMIFDAAGAGIELTANFSQLAEFILILWIVVTLSAVSPVRLLKKMNTAQEIKYE